MDVGVVITRQIVALILSAGFIFGTRTVIAPLTRFGKDPWPWKPGRWRWMLVGVFFLAELLLVTSRAPN